MAVPLIHLNGQSVVVAQVRIFNLVHAAVSRIGPGTICRCVYVPATFPARSKIVYVIGAPSVH
jgi:hypothetical protein